jgi:uncharacterized protein (DUF2252 family)
MATQLLPRPIAERETFLNAGKIEASSSAVSWAAVVGEAHAQQIDKDGRREWHTCLKKDRSKKIDAPSWLWTSGVQLVASHESAYLEHCRQYALDGAK